MRFYSRLMLLSNYRSKFEIMCQEILLLGCKIETNYMSLIWPVKWPFLTDCEMIRIQKSILFIIIS